MSNLKEVSSELRSQIEVFFTSQRTGLEVKDFVSKMKIKSSYLVNPTMTLMPFTLDDYSQLKVSYNQLDEFLGLVELLDEKEETYLRKEWN